MPHRYPEIKSSDRNNFARRQNSQCCMRRSVRRQGISSKSQQNGYKGLCAEHLQPPRSPTVRTDTPFVESTEEPLATWRLSRKERILVRCERIRRSNNAMGIPAQHSAHHDLKNPPKTKDFVVVVHVVPLLIATLPRRMFPRRHSLRGKRMVYAAACSFRVM